MVIPNPRKLEIALPELLRIDGDACAASFYEFIKHFWDTIIPDPYLDNWHIPYLASELQVVGEWIIEGKPALYDLLINVPPGTSKTTLCTIMFPAWVWTRAPWAKFLMASYAQDLSTRNAVKTRDILRSAKYQATYPDQIRFKADMNNKTFYENTKKGSLYASSVGGTMTGFHAHCIGIDDPINPKQARSEELRTTAREWLDGTVSTRKVDKDNTPTIMVMQRLAEDDPSGHWLSKEGKAVRHICLPGEVTELNNVRPRELEERYKDGLLDPVRLGRRALAKLKMDLGDQAYGGQILQSPKAAEGNIFKKAWWKYWEELPNERPIRIVMSLDTAFKEKKSNDFNVCTTWLQFSTGYYLVDFWEEKVQYPVLKTQTVLIAEKHKPHAVLVEDKASGTPLIQELGSATTIPIVGIIPVGDKVERAHAVTPTIKAGNVWLPLHESWTVRVVDQCSAFPAAKNDDIVDTITQFLNWVREQGSGVPLVVSGGNLKTPKITQGY
ncbi:MAG: phage terminase large subunit [Fibrobacteria bacterium]